MAIKKHHVIRVVGLLVMIVALWYSLRGVEWARFGDALRRFKLVWLVPGLAAFYYSMYLRAVRWGLLFRPHYHLSGARLFRPIMICFGFNSILPGRVGEFARAYLVGKREGTGVTTALATVLTERIFDGVTLLAMLAMALAILPPIDPDFSYNWGQVTLNAERMNMSIAVVIKGCFVLTAAVVVFMIPWVQRQCVAIIGALGFLPEKLRHGLIHIVEQVARGFGALREPWPLVQIVFHSIVLWLLVGLSNLMIAYGFSLDMNFLQALALVTMIGLFIIIPATPGYWGLYEAGGIFTLFVLGVTTDKSLALAYTMTIHLVQYVPIVALGLFFAWRSQIRLSQAKSIEEEVEEEEEAEEAEEQAAGRKPAGD